MTERRHYEQQPPSEQLSERLGRQLEGFLGKRQETLTKRGKERSPQEQEFLGATYKIIFTERNEWADAITSPEGERATEIAERLLPTTTYFADCIDGRVSRTIKYGLPLGVGGSIPRPAGDMPEFAPAADGGVLIDDGSYFSEVFDQALNKSIRETLGAPLLTQVLDSHIECAAQKREEESKGRKPLDGGLLEDVKRKKEMAQEMQSYVSITHPGQRILTVQTSFDPESGFEFMGLEQDDVLNFAAQKGGFTEGVLNHLLITKKVINTWALLEDSRIHGLLEAHMIPDFDWRKNYKMTLVQFWEHMDSMVTDGLLDYIGEKVKRLYPEADALEVQERSMLLAMNTYNAYHLNREGEYPYGHHRESWVSVGEGENGPYRTQQPFSVFSKAPGAYNANVGLAVGIVRQNRDAGRITDKTEVYSPDDFYFAPVPAVHSQVIRNQETDWDQVKCMLETPGIIPDDWFALSTKDFMSHIGVKYPGVTIDVFNSLNTLRKEMGAMYDYRGTTGRQIFNGQIEVLPVLVDSKRRVQGIVPFVHPGFSRS